MNTKSGLRPGIRRMLFVLVVLWLCPLLDASGTIEKELPTPLGYVSDYAEVFGRDWKARIRSVCRDLERKTGVEMVVVTTNSSEPFPTLREYADGLYQYWRIGSAQRQHGVMVVASTTEPGVAVTLGRNMIRVIRPALLQELAENFIEPSFTHGQYGEGVYRAVVALAAAAQDVRAGEPPRERPKWLGFGLTLFAVATLLAVLWWISRPDRRQPYKRIQQGEFWGTGRGGFGGNFGGFGGGTSGESS